MARFRDKQVSIDGNFTRRLLKNILIRITRGSQAKDSRIPKAAGILQAGILLFSLSISALATDDPAKNAQSNLKLTLRVYDYKGLRSGEMQRAIGHVNFLLAGAGVSVVPIYCTTAGHRAVCSQPPNAVNINLRIVPTAIAEVGEDTLGYTLGFMLTVNYTQLERTAEQFSIPTARILGCVVAHELGHVLLGANAHSNSGVMRETWREGELARVREMSIGFLPFQEERIRAYVQSHGLMVRPVVLAAVRR